MTLGSFGMTLGSLGSLWDDFSYVFEFFVPKLEVALRTCCLSGFGGGKVTSVEWHNVAKPS